MTSKSTSSMSILKSIFSQKSKRGGEMQKNAEIQSRKESLVTLTTRIYVAYFTPVSVPSGGLRISAEAAAMLRFGTMRLFF